MSILKQYRHVYYGTQQKNESQIADKKFQTTSLNAVGRSRQWSK